MSKHQTTRARWLALATLSLFAAVAPQASADSSLPAWSCRASAAYVEVDPLLGDQRVEPVLANGVPNRAAPDSSQCASTDTGVQDIDIPSAGPGLPLLTLGAASASTEIDPEFAAARDQDVAADSGIAETVTVNVGGLTIDAEAITSSATGDCVNGAAQFTGSSKIARLTINDQDIIDIPAGSSTPFDQIFDLNVLGLVRVRLNQQIHNGSGLLTEEELIQRAVHIEILPNGAGEPLARVVLGETKVDRHGFVCAAAPPDPTCPGNSIPVPNSSPLVCTLTVTAPCPSNTTPNEQGACVLIVSPPCGTGTTPSNGTCIATPITCPAGTTRDTKSNACILLLQRPCPSGATADRSTGVCVATTAGASTGENGRIGTADGPRATCGRLSMRFVRGQRNFGRSFTSIFGNRTVTRGTLVTCGSNPRPIVGARIDVVHVIPGRGRFRKTGLRTRARGASTLILPVNLRTRRIEYSYRPDLRSSRITSRVTLSLTVKNRAGRILR